MSTQKIIPTNHKMELNIYLFCAEYMFNHETNKDNDINKYKNMYYTLLHNSNYLYEGIYYKRLFNVNRIIYLEQLEYNIQYCVNRLRMDEVKKEYQKK
jgi:hypothetical protein